MMMGHGTVEDIGQDGGRLVRGVVPYLAEDEAGVGVEA
jgi:hypothetical protein